ATRTCHPNLPNAFDLFIQLFRLHWFIQRHQSLPQTADPHHLSYPAANPPSPPKSPWQPSSSITKRFAFKYISMHFLVFVPSSDSFPPEAYQLSLNAGFT
ncbi:MAG: hypothetical protein OSA89_19230, partial [Mariniblastus sp.]|nr:hypothetical protein [Mariniblastus sp.]